MRAFHEPTTVDEAVGLLAGDDEARCLAGGASLVAMMNFGMLDPSMLVSLRRIGELGGVADAGAEGLRIGAMTTHRTIAGETRLTGANAVLREAAASIDVVIRNMGTIGGAVSHADPSSDMNTALVAAGARAEIAGPGGRRTLQVADLFEFYLTTTLAPGEMVTAINLPRTGRGTVGGHDKVCRVHGDTATVNVAVTLELDKGIISSARLVFGGCGPVPLHQAAADACLVGGAADDGAIDAACAILVEASDPPDDVRGSADYRRMLMPRLARRLIRRLIANGGTTP